MGISISHHRHAEVIRNFSLLFTNLSQHGFKLCCKGMLCLRAVCLNAMVNGKPVGEGMYQPAKAQTVKS